MNAKLIREFVDWPTDQQQELIEMCEEMDQLREQNNSYRAQLALHYDELLAKVPWWRRWGMQVGYWLHEKSTPKWFYGVRDGG